MFVACLAQSDARPTGDLEVAGSISAGPGNIHSLLLIMKYFQRPFSLFCLLKNDSCQFQPDVSF